MLSSLIALTKVLPPVIWTRMLMPYATLPSLAANFSWLKVFQRILVFTVGYVQCAIAVKHWCLGERCGCLLAVTKTPDQAVKVRSQLAKIARPMISNPPAFGARIVEKILNDPALFAEW